MKNLTEEQIRRQDIVDNAIYQLICDINPTDKDIKWDIEFVGELRDIIRVWLVEKMKITDEQKFYPYIKGWKSVDTILNSDPKLKALQNEVEENRLN